MYCNLLQFYNILLSDWAELSLSLSAKLNYIQTEVSANTRQDGPSLQTPGHPHHFYWRGLLSLHSSLDLIIIIVVLNRFSARSWSQTPSIVSRSVGGCPTRSPKWVCWRWSRPGHPAGSSPTIQSIRESEDHPHPKTPWWWVLETNPWQEGRVKSPLLKF